MTHPHLNEARRLFETSEAETDPARKFAALEEALELVDLVLEDTDLPKSDSVFAENLRHSNIRRLLRQLVGMRDIQFNDWFNYICMLLMQHEQEVSTIVAEDSSLEDGYQAFLSLWASELKEALDNAQK